jgi:hypothetical protein
MEARKKDKGIEVDSVIEGLAKKVKKELTDVSWLSGNFIYLMMSEKLGKMIEDEICQTLKSIDYSDCQKALLKEIYAKPAQDHIKQHHLDNLAGELQPKYITFKNLANSINKKTGWCAVYCDALIVKEKELACDARFPDRQKKEMYSSITEDKDSRRKRIISEFFVMLAMNADEEQLKQLQVESKIENGPVMSLLCQANGKHGLFDKRNDGNFYRDYTDYLYVKVTPIEEQIGQVQKVVGVLDRMISESALKRGSVRGKR